MKKVLLVCPEFPVPTKSIHHKNALPVGLLRLSSYHKDKCNAKVELVHGNKVPSKFEKPDTIEITTLFTYWSQYVWDNVKFYRELYPDYKKTKIRIGGIYASLHNNKEEFVQLCRKYHVTCYKGIHLEAEEYFPDYELLFDLGAKINFQIVHTSRGCHRKCSFCGTWIIEPEFSYKDSIKDSIEPGFKIGLKNLVFYDNNLLRNPKIKNILDEIIELKKNNKIGWCESQSGFDGRILLKDPDLASLLKQAGFRYPSIAWDWGYEKWQDIEKQIKTLIDGGFSKRNLSVFMIYNWDIDFHEMEQKRIKCWEWNVQITDCRNRPLDSLFDNYNPILNQDKSEDYYIHPKWVDAEVKQFRKNVRRQNICIRMRLPYHSKLLERRVYTEQYTYINTLQQNEMERYLPDIWYPSIITYPPDKYKWSSKKIVISDDLLDELNLKMASQSKDCINSSDSLQLQC
jgi:hypothetical protein